MKNQLNRLLATFSTEELNRFELFLASPYFNRKPGLLLLFRNNYRCDTDGGMGEKEKVQDRLERSELLALAEKFLILEARQSDFGPLQDQMLLREIARKRVQPLRVKQAGKRAAKILSDTPDGTTRARLAYELEWEDTAAKLNNRRLQIEEANATRRLQERSFLLEKLRLACESVSTQAIDPGLLEDGLLPTVLNYLEASPELLTKDALLSTYLYCYRSLIDANDHQSFERLLYLLSKPTYFDPAETGSLLLLAINACIRRINQGQSDAANAAFELYSIGLESGYLLTAGKVSRFTFSNVVVLALKAGDYARAGAFIDRYAAKLEKSVAQSTEALNRARLAYEQGQLPQAMNFLRSARDEDVLTTLNIRILQMRVYYQLQNFRLLDAHLDALDIYLRRRKNSLGYHYKAYRILTASVRKLRRINFHERGQIESFRREIEEAENLPEKNWLLRIVAS
ncbi:hypothetical protein CEQ90_10250 [Lewinellaceae bacterium SD302]|nr:hypothetical protein CEQ90_10250 [Lewinellaceae bacterium SD302]